VLCCTAVSRPRLKTTHHVFSTEAVEVLLRERMLAYPAKQNRYAAGRCLKGRRRGGSVSVRRPWLLQDGHLRMRPRPPCCTL
jgi:hypothetical protein